MHKQDRDDPVTPAEVAATESSRSGSGMEVVEYLDGGVPATKTPSMAPETAAIRNARLERECARLAEALTRARQDADARDRENQDRIAVLEERIDQCEHELCERDSTIATMTFTCDGLRAQLEERAEPAPDSLLSVPTDPSRSGDVVASLKARLDERGRALKLAREELAAVNGERIQLNDALGKRGQQVAQLLAQLTRGEVSQGFGMDFRSGLRRLFQRDPVLAIRESDAQAWDSHEIDEQTIVIEAASECRQATPEAAEVDASQAAATRMRVGGIRLRRYLLPLKSDIDPVFELTGPRSYVGRGADADVCIGHTTISRLHGVLYWIGGATIVEDARSANGVFVNQQRVQQAVLKDGDVVAFGNVAFHFRVAVSDG